MPQTKFVVSKALKAGLRPIVAINKIDKPERRPDEVVNDVFDLFANLDANDEQLDFPILYGSAKNGWMDRQFDAPASNMDALFQLVIDHVPVPKVGDGPFRFLATTISADPFLGRILTGRILSGSVKPNQSVKVLSRDGQLVEEPTDIAAHWRGDLVAFVIGCSFSFEEALLAAGVPLRHIARGCNVGMWRTAIACAPAGPFAGPLVVSMRPLRAADAIRAIQITSRFPAVHGAPVHLGDPRLIGIEDILRPHYGDAVPVEADELPVFWACGVTPQAAIAAARIPFAITHAPGSMLVTDLTNAQLAAF
jgi:uncharacterized protein YcsI (UPF0317 family)